MINFLPDVNVSHTITYITLITIMESSRSVGERRIETDLCGSTLRRHSWWYLLLYLLMILSVATTVVVQCSTVNYTTHHSQYFTII
jgi:hypothetical protein